MHVTVYSMTFAPLKTGDYPMFRPATAKAADIAQKIEIKDR